jgi:heme exporter protein A
VRLTLSNLAIDRGERRLIEGLSLETKAGDHIALRGPNGSGKTSLLRALAGLLRPAGGAITLSLSGEEIDPGDRGGFVHLLGHRDGLKGPLDALSHVRFWQRLLGGSAGDCRTALTRVGLEKVADLPARALSAGQSRRLALARLIAAPRPIWLLDEPAAALDTAGKALLDELITAHCAAGGITFAATHEPLGASATQILDLTS